jgi:hypothetical protein
MKSTVVPSPLVILSVVSIVIALVGGYLEGRIQGNKEIKALEAQYAEEDKEAAKAVDKLTENLKGCGSFATTPRTLISVSPCVLCCHQSFPPAISCNVGRAVGISENFVR